MLDKFADELREQREKSGLTLQQMATKTRIDLKFLEAIDQGNFSFLPDLYVKAFVKQYAKTIGLDENLIIKKFEAAREGNEYDSNPPVVTEDTNEKETSPTDLPKTEIPKQTVKYTPPLKSYAEEPKQNSGEDENKANTQLMVFGLGSVGLIIIAALLFFFVFNNSDKIIVQETPIEEVIEQSKDRYVESDASEQLTSDGTLVSGAADSLYLTFIAKETSWVFIVLDNVRTREFTLSPNSKFSVAASREFKATVGNSGGVTLQMNNQPVDFTGRSGSVRHFKLDRNGIVYLNAPPKLEQL